MEKIQKRRKREALILFIKSDFVLQPQMKHLINSGPGFVPLQYALNPSQITNRFRKVDK